MSLKEIAKEVMENHAASFNRSDLIAKFDRFSVDQFLEKYAMYSPLVGTWYPKSMMIHEDFFNLDYHIIIDNDRPITSNISMTKAEKLLEKFKEMYPDNSFSIEPIKENKKTNWSQSLITELKKKGFLKVDSSRTSNTHFEFQLSDNRLIIEEWVYGMECTQTIRESNRTGGSYGWAHWVRFNRVVKKVSTVIKWIEYFSSGEFERIRQGE